ncbi:MAG TPA: endo-1,3-alpha-glucanase family glycosylhydrolase [Polyangiaceae bacterium]|nr:endo-1,3-alpha-glucanase family glycosylhydrolase [Polyangiaceae bacterium]
MTSLGTLRPTIACTLAATFGLLVALGGCDGGAPGGDDANAGDGDAADSSTPDGAEIPGPGEGGSSPTLPHESDYGIDYHRLRVEFLDQGDWATLAVERPEDVIKVRLMEQQGTANVLTIDKAQLGLNTNLGSDLSVVVDYAILPDALDEPFEFHLTKGAAGTVTVRVWAIHGTEEVLLQEILAAPGAADLSIDVASAFAGKEPVRAPLAPTDERGIALYYPWYSLDSWQSEDLMDAPVTPYASNVPADVRRQMQQAKSAGITGFIVSFTGAGTSSDENIAMMLDVAEEEDFVVGFFLETTIEGLTNNPDGIAASLEYIDATYGEHPALMQVDGKAVVVPWLTCNTTLENWQAARQKVRDAGHDVWLVQDCQDMDYIVDFDGVWYDGAIGGLGEKVRYWSVLADEPAPKLWIPTAMPGFDEHLLDDRGPNPRVYPRNDGDVYRAALAAAVGSTPHWVAIYTWNEWWENTHIEPSEAFGNQYLDITGEYLEAWLE